MRHIKIRRLFFVLLLTIVFITACSKDSDNPVDTGNPGGVIANAHVNVKINGGGFDNQEVTLIEGFSSHMPEDGETYAAFWGKTGSDSIYIAFQFNGNKKGSFDWRLENYDAAVIVMDDNNAMLYLATSEVNTNVTNYGAVGERIEGTISGKLTETSSMDDITVSGSFSIVRAPDSE